LHLYNLKHWALKFYKISYRLKKLESFFRKGKKESYLNNMRAKCVCLFSENFETTMQVIIQNNMFHLRELNPKMGQWVLNLNANQGFTGREV
jgi:hypothetical protein